MSRIELNVVGIVATIVLIFTSTLGCESKPEELLPGLQRGDMIRLTVANGNIYGIFVRSKFGSPGIYRGVTKEDLYFSYRDFKRYQAVIVIDESEFQKGALEIARKTK